MLAIRRKLPVPKLMTSGVLAFTIGLTASAAYLSTTIERMPYSFNTLQQTSDKSAPGSTGLSVSKQADDKTNQSNNATIPVEPASSPQLNSSWAPYVAPSQTSTTQPSSTQSSGLTTITQSPAPQQPTVAPSTSSEPSTVEQVLQPVTGVVDGVVQVIVP